MDLERNEFTIDYRRDPKDGTFKSPIIQNRYRNFQLANQMHKHTHSCFKYCSHQDCLICRHDYPYKEDGITRQDEPVISCGHDRKKRRRINVKPQRNNAWINATFFDPLLTLAHIGNHDCQYISNTVGAAEYAASYIGKQEEADFKMVSNLIYRSLNAKRADNSDLHRLKCVGNAILDSTPIGSVEVMYALLGLQFVKKSRTIENVNALHRSVMSKPVELDGEKIEAMDIEDEPIKKGINSHFGKRDAYGKLSEYMWNTYGECHITFYKMIENYNCTLQGDNKQSLPKPSLIKLDNSGSIIDDTAEREPATERTSNKRFLLDGIIFNRRKKKAVINLCPYVSTDLTNETSCYAILLLHVPWPLEGEKAIVDQIKAVKYLCDLREKENGLPTYVKPLLDRVEKSERMFESNAHEEPHDNDDGHVNLDDDESIIIGDADRFENTDFDFDEFYHTSVSFIVLKTNSLSV